MRSAFGLILCMLVSTAMFAADNQSQTQLMKELEVMPVAGPESELLKREAGVWDAVIETRLSPGGEVQVSRAVETGRLLSGGLWLASDLKGTLAGQPYEGHGIYGYDPQKGKYTGVWVDSLQDYLATWEGTYDPTSETMIQWAETPDAMGKKIRWKSVTEWRGHDMRIWKAYSRTRDGKEFVSTSITYRRRKE